MQVAASSCHEDIDAKSHPALGRIRAAKEAMLRRECESLAFLATSTKVGDGDKNARRVEIPIRSRAPVPALEVAVAERSQTRGLCRQRDKFRSGLPHARRLASTRVIGTTPVAARWEGHPPDSAIAVGGFRFHACSGQRNDECMGRLESTFIHGWRLRRASAPGSSRHPRRNAVRRATPLTRLRRPRGFRVQSITVIVAAQHEHRQTSCTASSLAIRAAPGPSLLRARARAAP